MPVICSCRNTGIEGQSLLTNAIAFVVKVLLQDSNILCRVLTHKGPSGQSPSKNNALHTKLHLNIQGRLRVSFRRLTQWLSLIASSVLGYGHLPQSGTSDNILIVLHLTSHTSEQCR